MPTRVRSGSPKVLTDQVAAVLDEREQDIAALRLGRPAGDAP
jgi:hypothetical protein